jgi:valyl-tRNA synthetase
VFINALVRDEKGQKMSKSKGNVIDPLVLMDKYGTDALRFTLTSMSGQARDIKLSEDRVAGYRNFGTKLWNASRFAQMQGCGRGAGFDTAAVVQPVNRWIRGETVRTAATVTAALEACAFDEAASALYRFIWNTVCDWYLELAKPSLNGADEAARDETRAMVSWVLDQCLILLHPISPYITEALWESLSQLAGERDSLLISAAWPELPQSMIDSLADAELGWVMELVSQVRSIRSELNVPPGARLPLTLVGAGADTLARVDRNREALQMLARATSIEAGDALPAGSVPVVLGEATVAIPVAGLIDLATERARLAKEISGFETEAEKVRKKLGNADFISRAKPEVVEENRTRLVDNEAGAAKLRAALARLEAL